MFCNRSAPSPLEDESSPYSPEGCQGILDAVLDASGELAEVPIEQVTSPGNIRALDPERLEELCRSIAVHGLFEPILGVRRGDGLVEVIDGHYRVEATRRLEIATIRALLLARAPRDDAERRLIQYVKCVFRADLDPLGQAEIPVRIMEEKGWSQEEACRYLGLSAAQMSRYVSVTRDLDEGLRRRLADRSLNFTQARALARLPRDEQMGMASRLDGTTSADLEKRVQRRLRALEGVAEERGPRSRKAKRSNHFHLPYFGEAKLGKRKLIVTCTVKEGQELSKERLVRSLEYLIEQLRNELAAPAGCEPDGATTPA